MYISNANINSGKNDSVAEHYNSIYLKKTELYVTSEEKTERCSWKAKLILLICWTGDSGSQHMLHQTQNVCVFFFPCIISALLWSCYTSAAVPMHLLGALRCGTTDGICPGMLGRSLCRELSLDIPTRVFVCGPQNEELMGNLYWYRPIVWFLLMDLQKAISRVVYLAKMEFTFYCNPLLGKKMYSMR